MKYKAPAAPRLNYQQASPDGIKALTSVSTYVAQNVDAKLRALIELRVSQINGCAFCLNMHSQQARAEGESQQRLDVLSTWHETTFFTEAERAALTWAEAVTRLGDEPVSDELFQEMRRHFSEKEIVDQTLVIAAMNAWNRISISFGNRPPLRKE